MQQNPTRQGSGEYLGEFCVRERQVDELTRSNQELADFARVVSHDLRGPLDGVLLYSLALKGRTGNKLDEEDRLHLQYIIETTQGMMGLIENLLSYALVSGGDLEPPAPSDTAAIVRMALKNLSSAIAEAEASVTCAGLPVLPVHCTHMLQLFQNLIGNGIKYCRQDKPQIYVSAVKTGRSWLFSVRDNGVGIDSRYFDRIFEPFKRLHGGDRPGSGLGLSICKKIVESQGGRIWVESEVGKGSTFLFTIADERKMLNAPA